MKTFGRFRLDSVLGRGGMGEVWKARDESLGRRVALKFLKGLDAERLARFLREARTAATLEHANIATIYEAGEVDGTPYLAMQFIEGMTLAKAAKTAATRDLVRWIRDAAEAVDFANERGIVHRDLKPENLMVSGDRVYVMDFGLAKEIAVESGLTASGLAVGTPSYMSPEAARGEVRAADARTDVYGLGATLYDLLAGRAPFEGSDVVQILMAVVQDDPAPLPGIDPALAAVVFKCLEKDPARRYPGAKALADDLTRWLDGEPVDARPIGPMERFRRKLARRRVVVGILAGAVVIAAVVAAGTSLAGARTNREQADLVRQLRESAASCLQVVLDQRRAGRVESGVTAQLEAICARLSTAESHHLLGRVYRAQMRDADALVEQQRALAIDRSYDPARYERVVLQAALFREAVGRAAEEYARKEGARLAETGELAEYKPPAGAELAKTDPEASRLLKELREDLAVLPPSRCAAGLLDWIENRHDDARAKLRDALAADPALDEAVLALAAIAQDHDRHSEGEELLTAAIERDPGYVPFREARGRLRHDLGLHHRAADPEKAFNGAIADFDEVLRKLPARAEAWRYRGLGRGRLAGFYDRTGRDPLALYEAAIADFREAARLAPDDPQPWCDQAVAWVGIGARLGDTGQDPVAASERAVECANEALRRRPAFAFPLIVKGSALLNRGHHLESTGRDPEPSYEAAVEAYTEAIGINPGGSDAWSQRGLVRINWGTHVTDRGRDGGSLLDQAVADLERSAQLDPGDPQVWTELASARFNRGETGRRRGRDPREDYAQAEKDYNRATRLAPGWDVPMRGRGLVRTAFGSEQRRRGASPKVQYEAAEKDLDGALAINPKRWKTWQDRAHLFRLWGNWLAAGGSDPGARYEAAVRDAAEAVRLNPKAAEAWTISADVRCNAGKWRSMRGDPVADYEASVRDYGEALRINPKDARAWAGRGAVRTFAADWLLRNAGDAKPWIEGAFADFQKAIDIDPGDADTWVDLGDLRSVVGNRTRDPAQKKKLFQLSIDAYERAATLSPRLAAAVKPKVAALRRATGE